MYSYAAGWERTLVVVVICCGKLEKVILVVIGFRYLVVYFLGGKRVLRVV
jgi:hypothetical protein